MCSIFGSYNKDEFIKLSKLNSHRGQHSFSIASYDTELLMIEKDFGEFIPPIDDEDGLYIGHIQAPTTQQRDMSSVHPSVVDDTFLWHNGIIKETQLKKWNCEGRWDTECLHKFIQFDLTRLSEVDGSFACLLYSDKKLYLFRNDNCPMFVKDSTFSSVKFDGSESIDAGVVYQLIDSTWTQTEITFNTNKTFYWMP